MDYKKFSKIDNNSCLLPTQKQAECVFKSKGFNGQVSLRRILDSEQHQHVFWLCETEDFDVFLPLFLDDTTLSSPEYTILDPLQHNEFICQNIDCYICCVDEKGTSVWHIEKILQQELVEAVCHAQQMPVGEIYPAILSSVQTNKKFTSCWINETEDTCIVIAIDCRDVEWIGEVDLNSLNFQDAVAGDRICVHGIYYDVVTTPKGKVHLNESLMQVVQKSGV